MKARNGNDYTQAGYFATKYTDAFTEYLADLAMENMERGSGDVECPTGYFVRLGKRIMFTDDRGFVWHERYPSERSAEQVEQALDNYYCEWADEEEEDEWVREQNIARADRYLYYVAQCALENLDAFSFNRWSNFAEPTGPLG